MLACTLYIIHQIENRILVSFRNHFGSPDKPGGLSI